MLIRQEAGSFWRNSAMSLARMRSPCRSSTRKVPNAASAPGTDRIARRAEGTKLRIVIPSEPSTFRMSAKPRRTSAMRILAPTLRAAKASRAPPVLNEAMPRITSDGFKWNMSMKWRSAAVPLLALATPFGRPVLPEVNDRESRASGSPGAALRGAPVAALGSSSMVTTPSGMKLRSTSSLAARIRTWAPACSQIASCRSRGWPASMDASVRSAMAQASTTIGPATLLWIKEATTAPGGVSSSSRPASPWTRSMSSA